jgi:hypothetical protein
MKTLSSIILIVVVVSFAYGQELPPKHRGMHPRIQKDGKVVDENGKQLGYFTKDGKVCDVTGKTIGIIAKTGEVTAAGGKGIGMIQKDGSFKSKKGYVVTSGGDGTLMAAGKVVGHVDHAYKNKKHACAVHCFFDEQYPEKEVVDSLINQE